MNTVVFTGQGSILEEKAENWDLPYSPVQEIYRIAKAQTGVDVLKSLDGSIEDKIRDQQVIVYTTQMATYFLVTGRLKINDNLTLRMGLNDNKPDSLTGLSLGEYGALTAGGAFDFETGLRIVKKRNDLMANGKGTLMSVVGKLDPEYLGNICDEIQGIDFAIYKCDGNYSIGGPEKLVQDACQKMEDDKVLKLKEPAPLKGAPHTREFAEAAALLGEYLGQNERMIQVPSIPVIRTSSPEAEVYGHNIQELIESLERHVCQTIYFQQAIEKNKHRTKYYTVIGPGAKSIGKIIARIVKPVTNVFIHPISTIKGIKDFYDSLKKPKIKDSLL